MKVMSCSSLTFCRDKHIVGGIVFYEHTFLVVVFIIIFFSKIYVIIALVEALFSVQKY